MPGHDALHICYQHFQAHIVVCPMVACPLFIMRFLLSIKFGLPILSLYCGAKCPPLLIGCSQLRLC